jgi:O-antigen/teichoic acid export membrane protein
MEPGKNLSQRSVKSGVWLIISKVSERIFSFIRLVILARLLAPYDFGLMGVALLTMSILETFSQTGFQSALIQKKEDTDSYLNTAWTVSILRGLILFVILYFISPYAAIFFKAPQAKLIIQLIGFSILLSSFNNIGIIYFRKELEFNKEFIYQLSGTLADFIVAVAAAIILKNVWALVFGLLAGNAIRLILSYHLHPYRPHFNLEPKKIKNLSNFGKWIFGSSIVVFLATQGDDLFVSKILGIVALGFYQMAFRLANLPSSEIGILSRIAFPIYSKLQDDLPKLKNAYLKMIRLFGFLTVPLAGGIFLLAPQFTQIFLGDKWTPIIPALRILAISSLIREIIGTSGSLFSAKGRPDIDFKMNFIRVVTLAITIYPLTMIGGITGTSVAVLLAICACLPISLIGTIKLSGVRIYDYIKIFLPPLFATFVMSGVIIILGKFINQFQLIGFFSSVSLGIITFFSCMLLLNKWIDYPIFKDLNFIFKLLKPEKT